MANGPVNPFGGIKPAAQAVGGAASAGSDAVKKLTEAFEEVAKLVPGVKQLETAVGKLLNQVQNAGVKAFNNLAAAVKPVTDLVGGALTAGFGALKGAAGGAVQLLGPAAGAIVSAGGAVGRFGVAAAGATLKTADAGRQLVAGLAGVAKGAAESGAALLRMPFQALYTGIAAVQSQVGAFVGKLNPAALSRFNYAIDDLFAAIGQSLLPVLEQFTRFAKSIGGAFNGLSEDGQKMVAALAAGAAGMIAFGAAAALVEGILTAGIGPAIGALVGAIAGVALATMDLSPIMDALSETFSGLMNVAGEVMTAFMGVARPLMDVVKRVVDGLAGMASAGLKLVAGLAPVVESIVQIGMEIAEAFRPVFELAVGVEFGMLGLLVKGLGEAVRLAAPYISLLARTIGQLVQTMVGWVKQLLSFIGITIPEFEAPKGQVKDPTGLAAKSTSTGDVSAALQKARESAYMFAGGPNKPQDDPAKRTASATEGLKQQVDKLQKDLKVWITETAPVEFASALSAVIRGGAQQAAAGAGQALVAAAGSRPIAYATNPAAALAEDATNYVLSGVLDMVRGK